VDGRLTQIYTSISIVSKKLVVIGLRVTDIDLQDGVWYYAKGVGILLSFFNFLQIQNSSGPSFLRLHHLSNSTKPASSNSTNSISSVTPTSYPARFDVH
jgi:hypothetical protein